MISHRAFLLPVLAGALAAFGEPCFSAQVVPTGFATQLLVGEPFSGEPVGFALLPDGRRLLIERATGVVRLAIPGSTASASIATIPGVEAVHPERGLLGIAVDPQWPARPYLYFYYNHNSSNVYITMYTASGSLSDPASFALSLGSPFHLLTDIPDLNGIHNGGTLRFGPDGMLYASIGDDAQACMAQNLSSLLGSILRLDVSDMPGIGGGPPPKPAITPPDNPFPGPNENERLRFAWGLRNPFRFTIDPLSGDLTIGDVGSSFWEEINHLDVPGEAGANFGWPQFEGNQEIFCCGDCGEGNTFTPPVALMQHLTIVSIMGGPVVRTNAGSSISFPSSYEGNILFFELYSGVIRRLVESAGTWHAALPAAGQPDSANWGTGHFGACDIQLGPDGALYYLSLGFSPVARGLYRIMRTLPTDAPLAALPAAQICRAIPNPAFAAGGVAFEIDPQVRGELALSLTDVAGRLVQRLSGSDAGAATIRWDGRNQTGSFAPPGVYLWSLEVGGKTSASGKVTLLR